MSRTGSGDESKQESRGDVATRITSDYEPADEDRLETERTVLVRRRDWFVARMKQFERLDLGRLGAPPTVDRTDIYIPKRLLERKHYYPAPAGVLSPLIAGRSDSAFRLYISALYRAEADRTDRSSRQDREISHECIHDPWVEASWYRGSGTTAALRQAYSQALGRLERLGLARRTSVSSGRRQAAWVLLVPPDRGREVVPVRARFWTGGWHAVFTVGETLLWWALKSERARAIEPDSRRRNYGISDEQYARAQHLLKATKLVVPRPTVSPAGAHKGHVKHFQLLDVPLDNASLPVLSSVLEELVRVTQKRLSYTEAELERARKYLDRYDFHDQEGILLRAARPS